MGIRPMGGHSRGNQVHSRKSRSSRAGGKTGGLAMVERGLVRRKPRRPAGRAMQHRSTSFFPVKEHADPLLRSVTACHPTGRHTEWSAEQPGYISATQACRAGIISPGIGASGGIRTGLITWFDSVAWRPARGRTVPVPPPKVGRWPARRQPTPRSRRQRSSPRASCQGTGSRDWRRIPSREKKTQTTAAVAMEAIAPALVTRFQ